MRSSHPYRSRYAPLRHDTHASTRSISRSSQLACACVRMRSYLDTAYRGFLALPPEQRYMIYVAVGIKALILGVVIYIGPEAMFDATAKLAIWFASQSYGAVLLIGIVVIVSFPPLIGYGTSITLFGFGWGVHAQATAQHAQLNGNLLQAWLLASLACLVGATVSFSVLRFLIIHHSKRVDWISNTLNDPKYTALSTAVRRKGLVMAILIRFCPFPFAYSNLFFASLVDAVSLAQFFVATALITPKLLLHVWLGTRMFQLMDRDQRAQLDAWAKALNVIYIGVGSAVGAATGWIVWNETAKVLETIESERQSQDARSNSGTDSAQRTTTEPAYTDASDSNKSHPDSETPSPFILDFQDHTEHAMLEPHSDSSQTHRADRDMPSLLPR